MEDIEKIDMSLDDIIKLNRKQSKGAKRGGQGQKRGGQNQRRGGRVGGRGARGGGNTGTGARGAVRGRGSHNARGAGRGKGVNVVKGRGPNLYQEYLKSGTSPLNRKANTVPGNERNSQSARGGQNKRQRRGVIALRGRRGNNIRGNSTTRGSISQRGRGAGRGNRGRGGAQDARQKIIQSGGNTSIKQAKTQAITALRMARQTLQKIQQQQMRQNLINQRRGIQQNTVSLSYQGGQNQNQRQRRRWRQTSQSKSNVLTVSIDNTPTSPKQNRPRIKRDRQGSQQRQKPLVKQQILNLKPKVPGSYSYQQTIFAQNTTGLSLSDRFASDSEERKVFF